MQIYYILRLKKLLQDIKFQLLNLEEKKAFKEDYINTKENLEKLIKSIEIYLGNADKIWIKLRTYYLDSTKLSEKIKTKYNKSSKNFNSQDELRKQLDDFKDINL